MLINDIYPNKNAVKKGKRKGRGNGSGNGKTGGRGQTGDGSRSGCKHYAYFEGGQTPLYRKLPKRGFSNFLFKKVYISVNVDRLNMFADGSRVDVILLYENGIVSCVDKPVKLLGKGELTKKLTVCFDEVSKSAKEKVEKVGGKVIGYEEFLKDEVNGAE